MKFKSLKQKVLTWFIGIIFIILFVFSFLLYFILEDIIHNDIKFLLKENAVLIHKVLSSKDIKQKDDYLKLINIEYLILRDNDVYLSSKKFPIENFEIYKENENSFYIYKSVGDTEDAVYKTHFNTPYDEDIYLYQKEINNTAERVQEILTFLNPILLLLLIWVGINLINKILLPIKNLTKIAQDVNISKIPNKIKTPKENDEIKELIDAFNQMIERLKKGIETLNSFNNDVSHELKTPLTVIRGEIDLALKKPREKEYYINSFGIVDYEIKQIQKIIEELLLFTKYSKESIKENFQECYIDSILINSISLFEEKAKEKNIKINIDKVESIKKLTNPIFLNIIFSNLIDNAIKYSYENKNIYIYLFIDEKIKFVIKDEGMGIKEENILKITDKFFREDESRNKEIKGFGLGLSLVKNFVDLLDGSLNIKSQPKKGTTITILF